jgi:tRNA (pseudouridine54-N1)-methyltransferase
MERRFAIIGHRAQSTGKINLNDLAGSTGRIDVLARAVNTGLFLSHGIRNNTHVTLHLLGGPGPARRIWFDGHNLRGVHPDERAIAGQIGKALKEPVPAIGNFVELHSGLSHSGGGLEQTVAEWKRENVRIFVLDAEGESYDSKKHDSDSIGFILSDDQPYSDSDLQAMNGLERISLGETWLQGHACISIIHHRLDSH